MGRREHTVTVVWGQWEISEGSATGLTFTIPNLLPVCWWDSQLLLGNDLPAGDPEPFHRHLPTAPCPFPDRYVATTSMSGTSRVCHDPLSV